VGATGNPLRGTTLQDQDGGDVALEELWRDRAVALVFLRHYLCVQCRVGAMELERDRDLLPPSPNVWLVGMGVPIQARAFKEQTGVRFPVLLSPDLSAYEAMELPRGSLRQIFGLAAQRVARRRANGIGLDRQAATVPRSGQNRTGISWAARLCSRAEGRSCGATAPYMPATARTTRSSARRCAAPTRIITDHEPGSKPGGFLVAAAIPS
jgi:peroxiredoxin